MKQVQRGAEASSRRRYEISRRVTAPMSARPREREQLAAVKNSPVGNSVVAR